MGIRLAPSLNKKSSARQTIVKRFGYCATSLFLLAMLLGCKEKTNETLERGTPDSVRALSKHRRLQTSGGDRGNREARWARLPNGHGVLVSKGAGRGR